MDDKIQLALIAYERRKASQRKYQQTHKEKLAEISKKYYYKMKEDPVKYEKYLAKYKERYVPKKPKPKTEGKEDLQVF